MKGLLHNPVTKLENINYQKKRFWHFANVKTQFDMVGEVITFMIQHIEFHATTVCSIINRSFNAHGQDEYDSVWNVSCEATCSL